MPLDTSQVYRVLLSNSEKWMNVEKGTFQFDDFAPGVPGFSFKTPGDVLHAGPLASLVAVRYGDEPQPFIGVV
jgi:hypothetical protein